MLRCVVCGFTQKNPAVTVCERCGGRVEDPIAATTPASAQAKAQSILAPAEPFSARPGTRIANDKGTFYTIQHLIGSGGYADVYLAQENGHNFALKVLRMWEIPQEERKEVLARFEREYYASQTEHPYLVRSHNLGVVNGNPFFVMDYCPNGSLRTKLQAGERFTFEEVQRISIEMLLGLLALHQEGIIHRDLKPENVLFDAQNHVKLTDFGIAGFLNARQTQRDWMGRVQTLLGTVLYMPPEQLNLYKAFKTTGPVTDIFAFGVILHEILTGGHYPFGTETADIKGFIAKLERADWHIFAEKRRDMPPFWADLIERCLSPDPLKRFPDTVTILERLGAGDHARAQVKAASKGSEVVLRIMNGDETGRIYELSKMARERNRQILTIGWFDTAAPDRNDIGIVERYTNFISRYHATLEYDPSYDRWYLRDGQWRDKDGVRGWYASTNGVYVDGKRVSVEGVVVEPGNIVTLGDTTLRLERT